MAEDSAEINETIAFTSDRSASLGELSEAERIETERKALAEKHAKFSGDMDGQALAPGDQVMLVAKVVSIEDDTVTFDISDDDCYGSSRITLNGTQATHASIKR